jgi:hypothetical protein
MGRSGYKLVLMPPNRNPMAPKIWSAAAQLPLFLLVRTIGRRQDLCMASCASTSHRPRQAKPGLQRAIRGCRRRSAREGLARRSDFDKFDSARFQINIFRMCYTVALVFTFLQAAPGSNQESHLQYKVRSLPMQRAVRISVDTQVSSIFALAFFGLWLFLFIGSFVKDLKTSPVSAVFGVAVLIFFVSMACADCAKDCGIAVY